MDFNKPQKNNRKENKKEELKNNLIESKENQYDYDEEDFEYFDYTIELPLFPDDFEEYTGEKKISDDRINDWIEECIILLESDKSETYATAQAGDTKLVVLRIYEDADNYHYIIEVFRDRYTIEIYPEEL
ncbi:MAG TPA: hypothetical protein VK590_08525 [Saprospiraceae bacterium]|nr:hypothetical protein [Saprospiraceae bacterium]